MYGADLGFAVAPGKGLWGIRVLIKQGWPLQQLVMSLG